MRLLGVLTLLVCCSGPPLQPGTYDTKITYVKDTWPNSRAGLTSQTVWTFKRHEDNDTWQVQPLGQKAYMGEERGDALRFTNGVSWGCWNTRLEINVYPSGDAFTAWGLAETAMCPDGVYETEIKATGVRR